MHPILRRQLRQIRNLHGLQAAPDFEQLLKLVEQTYAELENDRRFAEHTLQTVSGELFAANETIRKETRRQIVGREAQLAMALQSSGDGLWSWDAKSKRLEFSPAWLQMLGYETGELPSDASVCARLIHPEDWETARTAFLKALGDDEIFGRELRILQRSGEPMWVLVRGRVVERDMTTQAALRLVGTVMNITAQKQIEKDLRAAKETAETANAAKSRFLAIMSHEIRTPMNGVLGFADLMADTPLTAQQSEYLNMIECSGKMLVEIINDILDFSRIESGIFELNCERFSPSDVTSEICDLMRPQAQAKNVVLDFTAEQCKTGNIVGDSLRFRQILLNLVGNAIKFTDAGRVDVSLKQEKDAQGESWIILEVRDTGAGIPKKNLSAIFEPFAQADMSITRKYGGSGLGLAITKRLLDVMGGSIEVESNMGVGSVFRVRLLQRQKPPESPLLSKKNTKVDGVITKPPEKIRALIVEDNRINRLLATRLLDSMGCEISTAEDGSQAVEMVRKTDFDVIFMDMEMPVMDGVTATRIIREIPGRENLPIIALSANALETDRALCIQAGMNGFISKPYEKKTVAQAISKVISKADQSWRRKETEQ